MNNFWLKLYIFPLRSVTKITQSHSYFCLFELCPAFLCRHIVFRVPVEDHGLSLIR